MSLQINDVSIRCMGCSQRSELDIALRNNWLMCEHCNFNICEECYGYLDEKKCLSYICSARNREIKPVPIPIEKILIFARENNSTDSRQGLLFKLFYEQQEKSNSLAFFSTVEKKENIENRPAKIQEETWKDNELVITKRRGGKFITWEKIY